MSSAGFRTSLLTLLAGCAQNAGPLDSSADKDSAELGWGDIEETPGDLDDSWAANWPSHVTPLGKGARLLQKLEVGETIPLEWAQQSSVACFPGTQNEAFEGPHVLFAVQHSPDRSLIIRASPAVDVDISLYTLMLGANAYHVPPDISSAVACEAELGEGAGLPEEIRLSRAQNPYNVVIGVAGSADHDVGEFLIEIWSED